MWSDRLEKRPVSGNPVAGMSSLFDKAYALGWSALCKTQPQALPNSQE